MALARATTSSSSSNSSTDMHRAEDLLAHDVHVIVAAVEHGRRHEKARGQIAGGDARAAGQQARPLGASARDQPSTLSMCASEMSAPTWVAGSSGSPIRMAEGARAQPLDERRVHALVHEHARAVRAHLARGIEIAEQRAGDRVVEVRIAEHDERRLAAELERHLLQRGGGIGHDRLAGADLAGERDLADVRVTGQEAPGLGRALHHLEHPVRQAGGAVHLLEPERA